MKNPLQKHELAADPDLVAFFDLLACFDFEDQRKLAAETGSSGAAPAGESISGANQDNPDEYLL